MPYLNVPVVQHRVAQLGKGRDALVVIAEQTDIPHGTLRNAVAGYQPLSLPRCYSLADAIDLDVRDVLANNDGVPDLPPKQPAGPKAPPKRQEREPSKGPRRVTGGCVA